MKALLAAFAWFFALTGAIAQSHQPYAGMQERAIKALSAQEIEDLRAGRGMGLALAAELNGYPGPVHVLELAERLELSDSQRARMQQIFEAMRAEAVRLGEQLIAGEARLERMFAERTVTPAQLAEATAEIARIKGALRLAHLKHHLGANEVLSPEQRRRYAQLRGYSGADAGEAQHGHGHGRRH